MKRARVVWVDACVMCGGDFGNRNRTATMYCRPCYEKAAKIKARAYSKTNRRVLNGEIPAASTLQCADCGVQAQLYDHRSYEPSVIEAVCRSCNIRRGPAEFSRVA